MLYGENLNGIQSGLHQTGVLQGADVRGQAANVLICSRPISIAAHLPACPYIFVKSEILSSGNPRLYLMHGCVDPQVTNAMSIIAVILQS